ncbi:MAG: hypothetical protein WCP45_15200 [Verrucomicrobiota bacterium]
MHTHTLIGIPTAALIAELQMRKTGHQAEIAGIDRALGERNNFQLADARRALEVAEAIAHEHAIDCPFILVERNRIPYTIEPRKLLHWWLRTQEGWSFERIALHCERDAATIKHSVRSVAEQLDHLLPVIDRIRQRLQVARIAVA